MPRLLSSSPQTASNRARFRHSFGLGIKDDRGYGRITADDGEVLFVDFSGIVTEGRRSLEVGQRVSFVWNGGIQDHGRHRAEDVRVER